MQPRYKDTIQAAARLLTQNLGRWLPLVAGLSVLGAVPEVLLRFFAGDIVSALGGLGNVDVSLLGSTLSFALALVLFKLILELSALMLSFVILADLTAGRPPNLWAGVRRLASLRLQLAWLVSGTIEQIAVSLWFVGAALLLVPFGFATTAAYEENAGMSSLGRSLRLGTSEHAPGVGVRLAVAVTAGFAATALVKAVVGAASLAWAVTNMWPTFSALARGDMLALMDVSLPSYGPIDIAFDVVLAPLGMLPFVYMMAVQQLAYWESRRAEEAATRAARAR